MNKVGHICEICREFFSDGFQLAEHKNIHTGATPFLCPNCGGGFSSVKGYVEHARKFPNKHYFQCQLCKIIIHDGSDFYKHACIGESELNPNENNGCVQLQDKGKVLQSENLNSFVPVENSSSVEVNVPKIVKKRKNKAIFNENFKQSCESCKKLFATQKLYIAHRNKFPGEHNFICNDCSRSFTSKLKLIEHLCQPVSTEPFQCSCLQFFDSTAAFREHVGAKPYVCCSCKLEFNLLANLIRHTRTHTQQKPYKCKYCVRAFTQASNLRNHISVHYGDKAIKCDLCSFSCKTRVGLFKHKRKHKLGLDGGDLRTISHATSKCPTCGREFRFSRNLSMHMKVHAVGASLCNECGMLFSNQKGLKKHAALKHGTPLPCPVCDKLFPSFPALRQHSQTHVTSKKFVCNICYKPFSRQTYLTQHLKTHSNVKKFMCQQCGQYFKVAASLKYHLKLSCRSISEKVDS